VCRLRFEATPVSQRSLEDQERLEVTGGISVVVQVIVARLRAFSQQGWPLVHALWPREGLEARISLERRRALKNAEQLLKLAADIDSWFGRPVARAPSPRIPRDSQVLRSWKQAGRRAPCAAFDLFSISWSEAGNASFAAKV